MASHRDDLVFRYYLMRIFKMIRPNIPFRSGRCKVSQKRCENGSTGSQYGLGGHPAHNEDANTMPLHNITGQCKYCKYTKPMN